MSTPSGSVEQLLVRIGVDIGDLKKGMAAAGDETKKFSSTVESVDKSIKGFRTQAVGTIQALGGIENAMDALAGKGQLTAGTISQLTQLLPLMATPAGAATTALGALGIGVMKVVESERKLKENRTAGMLAELKEKAEGAAKGWDAYFKAIEDGMSRTDAENIRRLAEQSATIDKSKESFLKRKAELEATNATLRESNVAIEADIAAWKESGKTHGWFGRTLKQSEDVLKANNAQIAANEATITQGYVPALRTLAAANKENADSTDEVGEAAKAHAQFMEDIERSTVDAFNAINDAGKDLEFDKLFRVPEGKDALDQALIDTKQNMADLRTEMEAVRKGGGLYTPEQEARLASYKSSVVELTAEIKAKNEAEKKAAEDKRIADAAEMEAVQQKKAIYGALGNSVTGMFQAVAFEGQTAAQAFHSAMEQLTMDAFRFGMQQIVAQAAARAAVETESETQSTAATQAGAASRTAARAAEAAAATGTAAEIGTAMTAAAIAGVQAAIMSARIDIAAKAAQAAAGASVSQAAIPLAGPALAASAAASTYAMTMGYQALVPGFYKGGVVDGPQGRDKVPAMLTAGEEVLRVDDPRHRRNVGRRAAASSPQSAPGEVTINLNLMGMPNRSGARRWIRDVFLPELRAVQGGG